MGKSSKPVVGFWYRAAYHHGITIGPIDAFLEFRGGDKTAWQGELTSSGTISINAPYLWGGEKDQGGIVGDVDVMFGEPTQVPNPYLVSVFGTQTTAWRGFTTLAFKGGRYGAMNPYPQKPSYKFRQILQGWDDPGCWYPEKAQIVVNPGMVFTADLAFPATSAGAGSYAGVTLNSGFTASDVLVVEKVLGMTYSAWSPWSTDGDPLALGKPWTNAFNVTNNTTGVTTQYWGSGTPGGEGMYATIGEAETAAIGKYVLLTGGTSYTIWLADTPVTDNRGGLSVKVWKGGTFGINPAHVLYYSRTNSEMGREPTSSINDASLRAAADKLYAESFGICPKWDPASESVEDFEKRICKLIGGSFTRSLEDSQWYLDLARGDYVLEDLPILTDDDILDFKEQPSLLDNAINSVSVSYFDPDKKETIVTPPVRALALVASFGTIHQTNEYPEIPKDDLAARVALRDLLTTSTPTRVFDQVTTRRTYNWRPNQYFRLQAPKRGIADMVCIVGDLQSGTLKSGAIKLKMTQDIYGLPSTSFVQVEPGVDTRPPQTPSAITLQRAIEAPYIEVVASLSRSDLAALPVDASYVMAVADNAAEDIDFTMIVAPSGGDYVETAHGAWCSTATVNEAANYSDTAFTVANGKRLDAVEVGMAALWDEEIVRVDMIDVGAGTITLGRGCADTVRSLHDPDSRLWFYATGAARDITEYTAAETVDVKLLSNTGSQQLPEASATALPVTFVGRQALPYPPANVQIGGAARPATVSGNIVVTWATRNRELQADQLIDATAASIAPEVDVRYALKFFDASDVLLVSKLDIGAATATAVLDYTGNVRMRAYTINDNGDSVQFHEETFSYTPDPGTTGSSITADTWLPPQTIINGGGDA